MFINTAQIFIILLKNHWKWTNVAKGATKAGVNWNSLPKMPIFDLWAQTENIKSERNQNYSFEHNNYFINVSTSELKTVTFIFYNGLSFIINKVHLKSAEQSVVNFVVIYCMWRASCLNSLTPRFSQSVGFYKQIQILNHTLCFWFKEKNLWIVQSFVDSC